MRGRRSSPMVSLLGVSQEGLGCSDLLFFTLFDCSPLSSQLGFAFSLRWTFRFWAFTWRFFLGSRRLIVSQWVAERGVYLQRQYNMDSPFRMVRNSACVSRYQSTKTTSRGTKKSFPGKINLRFGELLGYQVFACGWKRMK